MIPKMIPFVPLPPQKAIQVSRPFLGITRNMLVAFPSLETKLLQADLDFKGRDYLSMAVFSSLFWFFFLFGLLITVSLLVEGIPGNFILISFVSSLAFSSVSFFYVVMYPSLFVIKKVKNIDRNLLFAMRHLLIQIRSGVSLFDALVSVGQGNYGLVSKELNRATKNVTAGVTESDALEELAHNNPSLYFRRTVWQLVNAIKSGADLADTIGALVQSLAGEQRIAIRKYGAQLSPMAMMYMMFAVIIPALGITFMIVFSSMSSLEISPMILYVFMVVLIVFQFAYAGIVKNRRPAVEL